METHGENMLAHILALTIAFGSFIFYMAAFFFPEVHRKHDFTWSGIGLFYALVLWVCAGRITGGVLLGQTASIALLGWLGGQTLAMRRELTPRDLQTQLPGSAKSLSDVIQEGFRQIQTTLPQRLEKLPLLNGVAKQAVRLFGAIATSIKNLAQAKPKPKPPKTRVIKSRPQPVAVAPASELKDEFEDEFDEFEEAIAELEESTESTDSQSEPANAELDNTESIAEAEAIPAEVILECEIQGAIATEKQDKA